MSTQDRFDSNENNTMINLSSFVPGQDYVDNQVMIKFKPNLESSEIEGFQANLGASVLESTQSLGTQLWEIQGMTVAEAVATYSNHALIEYIEPNYLYSFDSTIPNDTDFVQLWGLDNTGQTDGTFDADIDAPEAWDISTGNNVVVGVMDSGVDYTHPDLINNMWTNPGEIPGNGIDDDGNGYVDDVHGYDFVFDDPEPDDNVEHGTHVAGTIAAEGNNNLGITGVAWNTQIMALKVGDLDGIEAFDAVQGLEYATMMKQDYGVNINLTNNSWGVEYSQALYDAIAASSEAGQLFVAAAGNSSSDNDLIPQYPASYDLDNIITVAATDHNDQLATFSNYGATSVDLGAPGVDIISTIPGGGYASYDGTSMAAPHVAGVASLIWSQDLTLSPEEVKERILTTVDPISALEGMTLTGGRLNAYNALLDTNPEVSLPINLYDSSGYLWDIWEDGRILNGTSNAYDGGLVLNGFPSFSTDQTEDNGREIVMGSAVIGNVEVTRKIYIPEDQSFARFLEIVTNTSSAPLTYTVDLNTDLGSDSSTNIIGTSNGDTLFDTSDYWIVTDDSDGIGDPTMLHVLGGAGGQQPTVVSAPTGVLNYDYDLTLNPGETQIVMHFAAQNPDQATALTQADQLAELNLDALAGMSEQERTQVVNFSTEPSLGEIHGSKWNDLDGDGEWDGNESGLEGWTIYLDQNQNGQLDTGEVSTLTDANGDYSFTNLTAGDYTVAEVLQEGWEQTYPSLSNPSSGTNFNRTVNQTRSLANTSMIEFAIERESEVNPYFARSQSPTTQWVIGLDPQFSADTLANRLGAQNLGATGYLPNTFIWEFSPNSARTIQKLETFAGVDFLYPLVEQQQQERFVGGGGDRFIPDDPLFGDQWHLVNTGQTGGTSGMDANVELAWDIAQGTGVVIGIVDDGLEYTHPDLSSQYLPEFSFDFNDDDFDPLPGGLFDSHGTSVAGVAAATGDNGIGVSGSAPSASLAGLRLIAGPANDLDEANALSYMNQDIDIYSNSWGPSDNGATLEGPGPMTLAALQDGVTNGRNGLGSIYVWAAGNGLENDDNVNYDGYANSRYTIAVSAIDHNGIQSDYSEPGAPILVSAYSEGDGVGITTTALLDDGSYTNNFGGTSSAAPLVSGVIALMLEANPNLSWRDIQHILVETAEQNDPLDSDWTTNGAGHEINHKYGFGAIDATAAVNMATTWTSVAPETSTTSDLINIDGAIPDNNLTGITSTITITEDINIESVEVVFDATHTYRGDLEVVLTSPDGTESILAEPHGDSNNNYNSWVFSSVRHWGESSLGDWTLTVSDELSGETGTWNFWQLNIYGTAVNEPQVPGTHTVSLTPGAIVTDINFGNQLIETPLNLSFETGDFTDWTTIGTASIQTAEVGSDPTDGDFHALITNGVGAVSDADLESFLGLNPGDLDNLGNGDAMEGSAIQLTPITVEAGDILSFDWNLITNEDTPSDYNDFGFVSISSTLLSELADTTNEFVRFGGSFGKETNYGLFNYQFTQAGTYTIGLGVVDADDTSVDSGLLVDNLQVVSDPFFNFGFENNDFTNWNAIGHARIETSAIGSNPTEGEFQSLITTGQGSMSDTEIESFLGLTPGALDNLGNGDATEGSALEFQPITVEAGDILSFDWNFISNEETPSNYNDFGFVSINSTSLSELADTNSEFFRFTGSFGSQTGYGTFEYQFMESGTVTVGIGVMDAGDTNVDSGLFVDNFQVVPNPMLNANTGFETGDFTDWNTMGQTTIETADFGSTPTEGNYQAFMTTESGAVSALELEEFLGLNPGALSSLGNGEATEGAALQFQPIIVEAGDWVSFDWNFLTDEATPGSYNDFGFVAINSDSLSELADTNSSFIPFTNSFSQQTGYGTFSYQFQAAGTYTIGMGVVDEGDTSGSSGLLVDNFSITSGDDLDWNTGFETGDFTDWNTMGQTSIETADFGSTPTEGNYQAFMTTESGAVSALELEEFLGLNPGALSSLGNGEATEGAALQFQPIIVEAGDWVSFDWNFLTDESTPGSYNDFGFVAINSDSLSELADTNSSFIPFTNSFSQQTGYGTFSYQFQTAGTYTIAMGVVDEGDTSGSSGLLVDNFSITSGDDFYALTPANQRTTDAAPKLHTIQGSLQGELLIGSDQQEDFILASAGDDTVAGGLGNDVIYGEDGDDKIWGNQGDDLLWGGRGNDTLKGGQGVDTFVLAVGEGTDKIRDFQITEDFIGLSGELTFEQLSITQHGKNTWIDFNDETLAILTGMNASTLTANVFTVV